MNLWWAGAVAAAGYTLGSLPFALLVARLVRGIDLREHGSGNLGATNAARVLGPGAGVLVFILDLGKGSLAALVGLALLGAPTGALLGGAAAAAGHVWPVFAGGRGGKALAASGGALLVAAWPLALQELAVAALAWTLARACGLRGRSVLTSLGLAMAAALPLLVWLWWRSWPALAIALCWGGSVAWAHRRQASKGPPGRG